MTGVPMAQSGMENIIKTGYLKKGRLSNRFSSAFGRSPRRWFVYGVRDGTLPFLEYYENEEGTFTSTPINSFDLTGCKKITYVLSPRNPSFTFCIVLQDRVIELTAMTRADLIDWCDRMERSLRQLGHLETLRGPDDEHVYVDAPFLLKRNKSHVVVEESSNEGDIHTSVSEVSRVGMANPDHPEDVPGMIYLPSAGRIRPITINGWDSEVLATFRESGRSLERGTTLDCASREGMRSLTPSLNSFLVEEKDNRPTKHPSKGLVRRSTMAVPRRNVEAVSKAESNGLVNGFGLNTEGPTLLFDEKPKPKEDMTDENAYGNLNDWTSSSRTNTCFSINSDSPEVTSNKSNDNKMQEGSTLGSCETDENANHKCPEEDLPLRESRKFHLGIRSPGLSKTLAMETDFLSSPVAQTSSIREVCVSPTSPLSPTGSLSDCLPDDEEVHHNVRQLLKFFEGSEVSGSSDPDPEDAGTRDHDTGAHGVMTHDKAVELVDTEADDQFSVFASLIDLGLTASSQPPQVPEQDASSKLPGSNVPLDQTNRSDDNQSPDMGYMSDKSPPGTEDSDSTIVLTSNFSGTNGLPKRYTKKKDQIQEETDVPPPLPIRPPNLVRLRPMTISQGRSAGSAPAIPPRRSLSIMQQVSNCSGAQSVVPLKTSQVELFRNNITSPVATAVELRRRDCLGTIAFVDAFGSVWIAGWNQRARPRLHGAFHLGDRLLSINNEPVHNAAAAQKFIKQCPNENLVLEVKTAPKAKVVCIQRRVSGQSLGLKRDGGTAEIIYIDPNGLAAEHGLASRASTMDNSGFCNWVLTEINSRPLNLFLKKNEVAPMLDAVGLDISLVVQPVDFVGALKRQLKYLKNYKDYILP